MPSGAVSTRRPPGPARTRACRRSLGELEEAVRLPPAADLVGERRERRARAWRGTRSATSTRDRRSRRRSTVLGRNGERSCSVQPRSAVVEPAAQLGHRRGAERVDAHPGIERRGGIRSPARGARSTRRCLLIADGGGAQRARPARRRVRGARRAARRRAGATGSASAAKRVVEPCGRPWRSRPAGGDDRLADRGLRLGARDVADVRRERPAVSFEVERPVGAVAVELVVGSATIRAPAARARSQCASTSPAAARARSACWCRPSLAGLRTIRSTRRRS